MMRIVMAVVAMALVTVLTRAAPFLFFARRKPPAALDYLQIYLPPALMTILVLASFKDIRWSQAPHGMPSVVAAVITALLHLWRRNVLLSIACGTAAYIALLRMVG